MLYQAPDKKLIGKPLFKSKSFVKKASGKYEEKCKGKENREKKKRKEKMKKNKTGLNRTYYFYLLL